MTPLEAFGWAGSVVVVASLLQTRILWLRVINSAGCLMLTVYNAVLGLWPMVALNTVLIVINGFFLYKLMRSRRDNPTYHVAAISLSEPFLGQVLARHEQDIRTFAPGLGPRLTENAERAYLVTAGDELAAVVVSRRGEQENSEQLIIDYALPRFRDFSAGEFVYSDTGPYAAAGRTAIYAPPGMKHASAYHRRVGFHAEGDRLVHRVGGRAGAPSAPQT